MDWRCRTADSTALATFSHATRELGAMNVGYLHVMEPGRFDTGPLQVERPTEALRPLFRGTLITNGGYNKARRS